MTALHKVIEPIALFASKYGKIDRYRFTKSLEGAPKVVGGKFG